MWQGLFSLGSKTFKTGWKQRLKMIWYACKALWTSLILNSLGNSLFQSLQRLRALITLSWTGIRQIILWFILTDFNTMWLYINTYFGSKFSFYRSPSCHVVFNMHSYLTRLMSIINNQNKLQVMQIIWNVMLYSQHFTFHWKLLVVNYSS